MRIIFVEQKYFFPFVVFETVVSKTEAEYSTNIKRGYNFLNSYVFITRMNNPRAWEDKEQRIEKLICILRLIIRDINYSFYSPAKFKSY